MINAITTKNVFSLYRKSRENKDEKKWIGKLIKSPKNRLAGVLSNKPLVLVYLTYPGKGDAEFISSYM